MGDSFTSQDVPASSTAKAMREKNNIAQITSQFPTSPISDPALKRTLSYFAKDIAVEHATGSGQDRTLPIKESYEHRQLFTRSTQLRIDLTVPPRPRPSGRRKVETMFDAFKRDPEAYREERFSELAIHFPNIRRVCPASHSDSHPIAKGGSKGKKPVSRKHKAQPLVITPHSAATRTRRQPKVSDAAILDNLNATMSDERPAKRTKVDASKGIAPSLASVKPHKPRVSKERSAPCVTAKTKSQRGTANTKARPKGAADEFCKFIKEYLTSRASARGLGNDHDKYVLFSDAVVPRGGDKVNTEIGKDNPKQHPDPRTAMIIEFQAPDKARAVTDFGDSTGLDEAELQLAANMGLTYDQYRAQKYRFFLGYELYVKKSKLMAWDPTFKKDFNTTRAQLLIDADVLKASCLFKNYDAWGWISSSIFTDEHLEASWSKFAASQYGKEAERKTPSMS